MVSIQDIAREADVSVATVSRVINASTSVRPETAKRVREVMIKLNYHPNFSASNLRKAETGIILVLVNSVVNPFLAKVIKGIEDASGDLGYHTMICNTYEDVARDNLYLNLIKKRFADGAITIGSNLKPQELRKTIGEIPLVQCSEYVVDIGLPMVTIDNKAAAYEATTHLIKKGRRRIAHITVENNLISPKLRLEGYKQALKDNNIEFDPKLIITGNYGFRNALSQVEKFFSDGNICDGIFAISDRMAAGAVKAARKIGYKIPHDIAVVGFDNVDVGYITEPQLTTVSQNEHEMGVAAINMLARIISGKETCESIMLNYTLIERESTNILYEELIK